MRDFTIGFLRGCAWTWLVISGANLGISLAMFEGHSPLAGAAFGFGVAAGCVSKAFFTIYSAYVED